MLPQECFEVNEDWAIFGIMWPERQLDPSSSEHKWFADQREGDDFEDRSIVHCNTKVNADQQQQIIYLPSDCVFMVDVVDSPGCGCAG